MIPAPQLYKQCAPAVVEIYNYKDAADRASGDWTSEGSGWVYRTHTGRVIVVTARHVIDQGGLYIVEDRYHHTYPVISLWKSKICDVGSIFIAGWHGPTLAFSTHGAPPTGTPVFNIGYPLGEIQPYVSEGYIASGKTGIDDDISGDKVLYLTVFLDSTHGDSGSPLLDGQGRVIGILNEESSDLQRLCYCLSDYTIYNQVKNN